MSKLNNILAFLVVSLLILSGANREIDFASTNEKSSVKRITIPLSWNITTASFKTKLTSTKTESFRGVWVLETSNTGKAMLMNDTRFVEVTIPSMDRSGVPSSIVLSNSQLAYLLGLTPNEIVENSDNLPDLVILKVKENFANEFSLQIETDVHYSVAIRFGVESF